MADADNIAHSQRGIVITELILAVFRTNGRLLRAGDRLTKDVNLTSARWQIFGAIEHNPKTVAQIARNYELTRQGVLWVVQAMLKEGLVQLLNNPDHQRAKLVDFTEKGRELFDLVSQRQRQWANRLAEGFEPGDIEKALQLVERLGELAMPED
ncbi:MarR family winged helix-turn-helix transcriptional regulator [Sphingobium subterraneum]|uniref:DNA-binding MarR family transcriptional regulator n=1 Tax=Sphingobium subterraneum TaxID=627688 RepID=A0A841IY85_9SPHN|nr:MarR family winged helix-turn-helix transcriptional regulator [Sphingobium subterraneum]MBB6123092.1 DNA-binding MarR family transcriptional regulator [Sphingobium subterraneum]